MKRSSTLCSLGKSFSQQQAQPRDKVIDKSKGGFSVAECRRLLREAGFIPRGVTPALQGLLREGKVKKPLIFRLTVRFLISDAY